MPPSLGTLVRVLTLAPGSHVTGPTPVLSESPYALLSPTSQICPRAFADDSTAPSLPSLARPPASTFPALLSSALGPGAQGCGCYTCSLSPCRTISSTLFSAHPRGCGHHGMPCLALPHTPSMTGPRHTLDVLPQSLQPMTQEPAVRTRKHSGGRGDGRE